MITFAVIVGLATFWAFGLGLLAGMCIGESFNYDNGYRQGFAHARAFFGRHKSDGWMTGRPGVWRGDSGWIEGRYRK